MQMPKIAKFQYASRDVEVRVRDGYVNVTQLSAIERRRVKDIMRGREYEDYLAIVAEKTQICVSSLVESRKGQYGRDAGTWAHPLIASWVAERLSSEAAFFVHATLRDLHLAGVVVEIAERTAERTVSETEHREIISRLQKIEKRRRVHISATVKKLHRRVIEKFYSGHCPRCAEITTEWECDHFQTVGDGSPANTWMICGPCNRARFGVLTALQRHEERKAFELYQANLTVLLNEQPPLPAQFTLF